MPEDDRKIASARKNWQERKLDPSLKRTVLSAGGGKPCITLLATGSVCAALGSFGASSARTSRAKVVSASASRLAPANMDARRALRRVMAFPRYGLGEGIGLELRISLEATDLNPVLGRTG